MFLFRWLRGLYDKTLKLAEHPKAIYWLAIISFAESSFFPIPPDILLLPLCLARRERAFFAAMVCTVASVLGGLFGYTLGFYAYDAIGSSILNAYGAMDKYEQLEIWYREWGNLMVFIAGLTPIPYKVVTIFSGVFHFPLIPFLLCSVASRGLRFFVEALLVWKLGEFALVVIDRHFNKLTIAFAVLLVGGFLLVKLLL